MPFIQKFWTRWAALFWLLVLLLAQWAVYQFQIPLEALRYERELLTDAPWRAVSFLLAHSNLAHLLLNASALILIFYLFTAAFRSSIWIAVFLFSALCTVIGLYYLSPSVEWMVGMSGPLHGLLVYALLRARAHWILLLLLAAKLIVEQTPSLHGLPMMNFTEQLIEANVVVDAHLWGAVGGLLIFAVLRLVVWFSLLRELNREA